MYSRFNALDSDSFAKSLIALSRLSEAVGLLCVTKRFNELTCSPLGLKEIPDSSEGMQWYARLSTCVSISASTVNFELSLSSLNPFEETTSGLPQVS